MTKGAGVIVLATVLAGCNMQTQSEGAHVHGSGKLNIAIETEATAVIEFEAPAESIYGFEHEATSDEDKRAQSQALDMLRQRFAEMLVLPPALGCAIEVIAADVVAEEHGHEGDEENHDDEGTTEGADHEDEVGGEHSEVHASYNLRCDQPLQGANARVELGSFFPDLHELTVTILADADQRSVHLEDARGEIDF